MNLNADLVIELAETAVTVQKEALVEATDSLLGLVYVKCLGEGTQLSEQ
jgi:hypothetical protein